MKLFWITQFLLFWLGILSAQSYHFQQYSVGDGLPQSQVYALLHDSRGYLWLGTQGGGLARFDGKAFQNYSAGQIEMSLSGNYVQAILEDKIGNIWLGTNNGVSRFDGRQFENFQLEGSSNNSVQAMAFGQNDTLWIAAQRGVYALAGGKVFPQKKKNGQGMGRMWSAYSDSRGTIWMGGGNGIFRKEKNTDEWEHVWRRKTEVLAIGEAVDGRIVAGAFDLGLRIWDGQKWERFTTADGLPSNRIQSIWRAPNGELWLGSQNEGAAILTLPDTIDAESLNITYLAENEGLCNKNIRSIAGDKWGNVWLGTSGSGVCKYGGQEFEHLTQNDGLRSNFVYSMATDTSGGLWLSAGDRGVSFRLGDSLAHFGKENGFYDLKCRSMLRASDGRIWIGTEGAGIATMMDADSTGMPRFRLINRNKGLAGNWIRDIAEDEKGNLWVATTDGGIGRLTVNDLHSGNYIFKNYGTDDGLPVRTVNQLFFDTENRLWLGAQRQGIFYLDKKERIQKVDMPPMTVRSLAGDGLGNLWFGTAGKGLGRFQIYGDTLGEISFFGMTEGIASNNIYLLQFDPQGQLWVGTERGVDRIQFDASGNPVEVRHFGLAEGFRGVEVCQNSSLFDGEGNLWFGTVNGLIRYQLSQADTSKSVAPQVQLTQVNLFYQPIEKTEFSDWATTWGGMKNEAVFPHYANHFGFEFFAPNFTNPDAVEYSWRLSGWEDNNVPWVKRNGANYSNLPAGEYSFFVQAKNEDGVVGEVVSTSFVIETPYWQTTWFRLLMAGLLAFIVGGIFWLRIKRLRKKAKVEKERLEMENHLLQLEQKARQLQMNPHFIFNALNSIQSLVTRGDNDGARQYILKFGRLMRAVLDNSRKAFVPLEKEIDTLKKYIEMEQFCRDGNFDFKINSEAINSDDLEVPPMLLQPFIENAILHGVAPLKDRRGHIDILFFEQDGSLKVEIKDNGVGYDETIPEIKSSGRTSAGVMVTKERINILGGKLEINSKINSGTIVELIIPLNNS